MSGLFRCYQNLGADGWHGMLSICLTYFLFISVTDSFTLHWMSGLFLGLVFLQYLNFISFSLMVIGWIFKIRKKGWVNL
jgi:hypothetical protein